MALTTYNITGSLKDALGGTSLIGEVTFAPFGTHDARVDGADALLGPIRYSIADLPATIALSAGGWVISIRSTGRVNGDAQFRTKTIPWNMTAATTWGAIVASAAAPVPLPAPTFDESVAGVLGTGGATDVELSATIGAQAQGLPATYGKTKVLILGSSNAQGYSASNLATTSWAALVATRLAATHDFVNPSVAGRSPTYWITPGGSAGRTPLEDLIAQHQPHIVIGAFATQNAPGQVTEAFIGYIEQTKAICDARGIRFIAVTPYISEDYDAAKRDGVARIGEQIKARGIPSLNFAAVWGEGPALPNVIDSGDGLHLNDAGHTEQARQIPSDMLSLACTPRTLRLPSAGGTVIPAAVSTTGLDLNDLPDGSWTIGFTMKLPAVDKWTTVPLYFIGGSLVGTRIRLPNANQIDVAGNIVHPVQGIPSASEKHIALTYNSITGESRFFLDGVRVSTAVGLTGQGATSAGIGYRPDLASAACTGYRFRNFTVHATVLTDADAARLAAGEVVPSSIAYAAGLVDGVARPAGAIFGSSFGQATKITSAVALP